MDINSSSIAILLANVLQSDYQLLPVETTISALVGIPRYSLELNLVKEGYIMAESGVSIGMNGLIKHSVASYVI